jgi:Tfp pilus assembly protein PilN
MPTAKKESKINLLPQKEFEKSVLGRTLRWALSSFRIIVVATEIVVMMAFLSRFWLDAKNSDLNELVAQKKAIILSFNNVEGEFRLAQKRLGIFSKLTAATPVSENIKSVISYLPPDISLNSVTENGNSLQIVGSAGSEQGIAQYLVNLESAKNLQEVTLSQIDSNTFTIKAVIKGS